MVVVDEAIIWAGFEPLSFASGTYMAARLKENFWLRLRPNPAVMWCSARIAT